MSALKTAKIGVWSMLNALIQAIDEGVVVNQNTLPLPELSDPSDQGVMQFLSLLIWTQWSNKFWADIPMVLNYDILYYLKNEIYNWYQDPQYPIAQTLYTYSQFYKFLDLANTYALSNRSNQCQEFLRKLLAQMRLNLNQWVWKTFQGDFNEVIALATNSLSQCQ